MTSSDLSLITRTKVWGNPWEFLFIVCCIYQLQDVTMLFDHLPVDCVDSEWSNMAAAKRKRLTEKEVFDQILDSDDDLFSVDDDSDSEDSEKEGYLRDAEIIDSESEVRTNVSGSEFDNDMSGHGSGSNDAPMPMSCDGTSDDESGSDDVPLIRGRLYAQRRYNSDQDNDRSWSVTGWARDRFPFTGKRFKRERVVLHWVTLHFVLLPAIS